MTIRLVTGDQKPLLSREEMQQFGNDIVTKARIAAIDAVRAFMHGEFLERPMNLQRRDIVRWRGRAREALRAWREVESLTTELLVELDRTREGNTDE